VNNFETTSTFYHLPEVEKCIGTLEELIDIVSMNSKAYLTKGSDNLTRIIKKTDLFRSFFGYAKPHDLYTSILRAKASL
jgi:hypothetical protein